MSGTGSGMFGRTEAKDPIASFPVSLDQFVIYLRPLKSDLQTAIVSYLKTAAHDAKAVDGILNLMGNEPNEAAVFKKWGEFAAPSGIINTIKANENRVAVGNELLRVAQAEQAASVVRKPPSPTSSSVS